jgi:glutamine cyclotransferase
MNKKNCYIWLNALTLSLIVVSIAIVILAGCSSPSFSDNGVPIQNDSITVAVDEILYTYRVINTFPHDSDAFTQGFFYTNGYFYEGTGLYGRSSLRKINPADGTVLKQIDLSPKIFGEGITACDDRIIQLTWREHQGYVYEKDTFSLIETFTYPTEGWGITYDGEHLVMSDGTSVLTFLDPVTYKSIRQVKVVDSNGPVTRLNELEYISGKIYANIWLTDYIVIIDPATGNITGRINLEGLINPLDYPEQEIDVLNGIAYDEENNRLFVTGKLWPKVFEIELIAE